MLLMRVVSHFCKFAQLMLSMCPLHGFEIDIDMKFKFGYCDGDPFDGAHPKIIACMDLIFGSFFMKKKDLHPFFLKSFLLL